MRKKILVALGVLSGLVLLCVASGAIFVAVQPTTYRIERSASLAAPPERVLSQLDDVRALMAWEPWRPAAGAPPITRTFSPVTAGPGAWVESRASGEVNRLTLVSVAPLRVEYRGENSGGPSSTQVIELEPRDGGTWVTWSLNGQVIGLGRILWPFIDLDRRVGSEMEAALRRLEDAALREP